MPSYNRFAGFRLCGDWPGVLSAYDRGVSGAWAAFWGNRVGLMADARLAPSRRG